MTMNDLIDHIHRHTNTSTSLPAVTKSEIRRVLESLSDVVTADLAAGGEITLPGLGKLRREIRAARTGRNPATGATLEIPAKTVAKFTPAKALKDALA